jgi:hypothetical protein
MRSSSHDNGSQSTYSHSACPPMSNASRDPRGPYVFDPGQAPVYLSSASPEYSGSTCPSGSPSLSSTAVRCPLEMKVACPPRNWVGKYFSLLDEFERTYPRRTKLECGVLALHYAGVSHKEGSVFLKALEDTDSSYRPKKVYRVVNHRVVEEDNVGKQPTTPILSSTFHPRCITHSDPPASRVPSMRLCSNEGMRSNLVDSGSRTSGCAVAEDRPLKTAIGVKRSEERDRTRPKDIGEFSGHIASRGSALPSSGSARSAALESRASSDFLDSRTLDSPSPVSSSIPQLYTSALITSVSSTMRPRPASRTSTPSCARAPGAGISGVDVVPPPQPFSLALGPCTSSSLFLAASLPVQRVSHEPAHVHRALPAREPSGDHPFAFSSLSTSSAAKPAKPCVDSTPSASALASTSPTPPALTAPCSTRSAQPSSSRPATATSDPRSPSPPTPTCIAAASNPSTLPTPLVDSRSGVLPPHLLPALISAEQVAVCCPGFHPTSCMLHGERGQAYPRSSGRRRTNDVIGAAAQTRFTSCSSTCERVQHNTKDPPWRVGANPADSCRLRGSYTAFRHSPSVRPALVFPT